VRNIFFLNAFVVKYWVNKEIWIQISHLSIAKKHLKQRVEINFFGLLHCMALLEIKGA